MEDIVQIADAIHQKILQIQAALEHIEELAHNKAKALADYERQYAITCIRLKNGVAFTLGTDTIQNPPATLIDKIAKGICHKERLESEKTESLYKLMIVRIDALQAQMNGYQSINRHLSTTTHGE
jgi:hypothetical protein